MSRLIGNGNGNSQIGNVEIGNGQIENVQIGNTQIGSWEMLRLAEWNGPSWPSYLFIGKWLHGLFLVVGELCSWYYVPTYHITLPTKCVATCIYN